MATIRDCYLRGPELSVKSNPSAGQVLAGVRRQSGDTQWKPPDVYPNSGLLGLTRDRQSFLTEWQNVLDAMKRDFSFGNVLKTGLKAKCSTKLTRMRSPWPSPFLHTQSHGSDWMAWVLAVGSG